MSYTAYIKVERNELPKLSKLAPEKIIDAAARELAFEVLRRSLIYLEQQVYTRPNVQVTTEKMATVPEPTGALWNSGYVRSYTGELPPGCPDQESAMSAAQSKHPDVVFGSVPPGPAKLGQAQVLFAAEYGLYVEMGTVLGMVARPYLVPAVNETEAFAVQFLKAKLLEAGFI